MPVATTNHTLAETARRICESRGGKWSGTKGMACCPAHDDRTPSLGVSLGRQAILFHCFAGCDQESVLAALAREGVQKSALFSRGAIAPTMDNGPAAKPSAAALRIWRDAQPLHASPAKAYLESRGILAASPVLRFHPKTPLGPRGQARFLPAMIAAVSLDEGPIAIHRTFLSGNAKADFEKPKRTLGALGEAAVRLFAPAFGKLGLAEGIESAMSAYALTGIPVWATLGNERFGLVSVPDSVTELHLFVDHDAGGELAVTRGLAAYARDARTVQVRKPSSRDTDWNDELTAWLRRKAAR
ncbi:MAG: toprim domain-containing protein [Rhizobiaceae bacterium]|nr:toprim domain-containing protein [Rhizobiaceae bacterium]